MHEKFFNEETTHSLYISCFSVVFLICQLLLMMSAVCKEAEEEVKKIQRINRNMKNNGVRELS